MAVSACSSLTHNPPLLAASPQTSRHSLLVSLQLPGISSCLPSRLTTFRKSARLYSLGTHFPDSPFSTPEDGLSIQLQPILDEGQFDSALSEAQQRSQPIIVDWMAAWCRKCIYLKPKLEKLAAEFHPDVKFYCLDVNAVPQALVKRADVTSMPTIQLWKDGKKCDEVIGGHKAWLVMDEVREMLQKHVR